MEMVGRPERLGLLADADRLGGAEVRFLHAANNGGRHKSNSEQHCLRFLRVFYAMDVLKTEPKSLWIF